MFLDSDAVQTLDLSLKNPEFADLVFYSKRSFSVTNRYLVMGIYSSFN